MTTVTRPPGSSPESVPEWEPIAREHLRKLKEAQRARLAIVEQPRRPWLRRAGRRVRREWTRVRVGIARLKRATSPRYALGRRLAWLGLLRPPALVPLLVALVGVGLVVAKYVANLDQIQEWMLIVYAAVAGVPAAGSLAYIWDEYVQCPWRAWMFRRRIRKFPACILPSTPASRDTWFIPSEDPFGGEIIPRDDLNYEVLPGILRRHHRDVQVVVGEPGSGKTTALVGLAGLLAKIGMVPVLVPLRGQAADEIVKAAEEIFKRQLNPRVRSSADADKLWRWLYRRKRIAVLTDDIDQIGPDGERGFVLRRTLDKLATEDLPIVVTARPAGIPAGVAASSIELGDLRERAVVAYVRKAAKRDPGSSPDLEIPEREVTYWVREGRLTEAPFYLELLASLYASGKASELPAASVLGEEGGPRACFRQKPDGSYEWNPLWVRFRLLERYYEEMERGGVRRWLGIEPREREAALKELANAALGTLRATGCEAAARAAALAGSAHQAAEAQPRRNKLEHFLDPDDRRAANETRMGKVSAHEVVDSGERLRILERDDAGELQFRHRIMQAYLAGRRLAAYRAVEEPGEGEVLDMPLRDLLDSHHPEKLTAHMAVTFAALSAYSNEPRGAHGDNVPRVNQILDCLVGAAAAALPSETEAAGEPEPGLTPEELSYAAVGLGVPAAGNGADPLDPRRGVDPESRTDPDDSLLKITTAADIAQATDAGTKGDIVALLPRVKGATRWTKLGAISSIAALDGDKQRWKRMWEFSRDPDYKVRRAASEEIQQNARDAYEALQDRIGELILHAAARSATGLSLDVATAESASAVGVAHWHKYDDMFALRALGWVLPAIVSGLREESFALSKGRSSPDLNGGSADSDLAERVRAAREALDSLIALALEGGRHDLEASLAQGFKSDAMRHADDPEGRISGPGWVASHRRVVADIGLGRAGFWYARMVFHQALALYAIAGAPREEIFESFSRAMQSSREPHEFVRRAAKLARRAVERKQIGSDLWTGLIWNDEGEVVGRRATALEADAARLVADVTLLLNLNEGSGEDRQAQFGYMRELPYCLTSSKDRREILGAGCPAKCGWGLCPYKQPPPDEPNAHRGVSRAFCRQQQQIAGRRFRRVPPWHRAISRRSLDQFWWEMERRARI